MVRKKNGGKNTRNRKHIVLIGGIAVLILVGIRIGYDKMGVSALLDEILRFTPENLWLAAVVLCIFFALKSVTVVIPLSLLYLLSGLLFPVPVAIGISIIGLALTLSIPYVIGFYFGERSVRQIRERYPVAWKIDTFQKKNPFFVCFFVRIIGCLPGDLLSLYLGACHIPYLIYLLAGLLGSLLSILTTTLLGTELHDPFSISFFLVLTARILVLFASISLSTAVRKNQSYRKSENSKKVLS